MSVAASSTAPQPWRQVGLITAAAVGIYFGLRLLPTGTNLSHMDFRVDPKAGNAIEFCDPLNPQFIPVVAARSPVSITVTPTSGPLVAGTRGTVTLRMSTTSGKPVLPEDLLITHTRRLHLLIVDPSLSDYQHVHPEPTKTPGEWMFAFLPKASGDYRVFADFTPAATGRGLYASADIVVVHGGTGVPVLAAPRKNTSEVHADGYRFILRPVAGEVRAGQPVDLRFSVRADGQRLVPLQPVMGAFAHLVAFDEARSGFAHLHPVEADASKPPDATQPVLHFKLTIPRAGSYVVWAQLNLGGTERFVPFELSVAE